MMSVQVTTNKETQPVVHRYVDVVRTAGTH